MKKILLLLLVITIGCVTAKPISVDRIKSEMTALKNEIAGNRSAINRLKALRLGTSGFYYIIDIDGMVVFHPQSALIGSSFKDSWFIDIIAEKKSGCLAYQLGTRTHVVYYEQLNASEILCLSILAADLPALPVECLPPENK